MLTSNIPVNFYIGSQRVSYELVINEVLTDQILGYICVPKGHLQSGPPSLTP